MPEFISHTTNLSTILTMRSSRDHRFLVSAHIRPGEYTAAFADSKDEASRWEESFRKRGCYQITTSVPRWK